MHHLVELASPTRGRARTASRRRRRASSVSPHARQALDDVVEHLRRDGEVEERALDARIGEHLARADRTCRPRGSRRPRTSSARRAPSSAASSIGVVLQRGGTDSRARSRSWSSVHCRRRHADDRRAAERALALHVVDGREQLLAARSPVAPNSTIASDGSTSSFTVWAPGRDRRRGARRRLGSSPSAVAVPRHGPRRGRRTGRAAARPPSSPSTRVCDANRASTATPAITGAGTPRRTASSTVQRPSPESLRHRRDAVEGGVVAPVPSTSRSSSHDRTTLPCCHDASAGDDVDAELAGGRGSRRPRRTPASSRTRCRCGPSSCSGRRRSGPTWAKPPSGARASNTGWALATSSAVPPTIRQ